MLSAHLKRFST